MQRVRVSNRNKLKKPENNQSQFGGRRALAPFIDAADRSLAQRPPQNLDAEVQSLFSAADGHAALTLSGDPRVMHVVKDSGLPGLVETRKLLRGFVGRARFGCTTIRGDVPCALRIHQTEEGVAADDACNSASHTDRAYRRFPPAWLTPC